MIFRVAFILTLVLGWASSGVARQSSSDTFRFPADALAYPNELASEYVLDPLSGKMALHPRVPRPSYALRCFVVVRTARQFLNHARFEPGEPKATPASYRYLVRLILAQSPRRDSAEDRKIVIPGYTNLREFSAENEALLKAESGGAWQSFLQRGNWRMVFPFSRGHQERMAVRLAHALHEEWIPIVHVLCFPSLTLNHALLLFGSTGTRCGIEFDAYDPNLPDRPIRLMYDREKRGFYFPSTPYFAGGAVNVYEIYRGLLF